MQAAEGNRHVLILIKHGLKVSQGKINDYILSNRLRNGEVELISKKQCRCDFL